jgi:hypothetical protein
MVFCHVHMQVYPTQSLCSFHYITLLFSLLTQQRGCDSQVWLCMCNPSYAEGLGEDSSQKLVMGRKHESKKELGAWLKW